ncbi:MAG: ABC transporter substrate-binding protein [Patescibacteria group bacterium]
MQKFLTFIKEFKIPKKKELLDARASFSKKEFIIFVATLSIAVVAMIVILEKVNISFMVPIPSDGGTINEGIIGTPTLVNPALALSDADKDLTTLVYSGLMRKMPNGDFINDLAESYDVSGDGMTYTFILKKNAKFQDGVKVTADDIVFTIEKIKDPLIKSPRKIGWDGVSVSKKDESTIVFTLKQPYISFIDNTTIGILPMHIWKNVTPAEFGLSSLNIKAIGSGPYLIDSVSKDSDGVPNEYQLKRFKGFVLGEPHIKYMNIISYSNEKDLVDALLSHSIDQASGISPENARDITKAEYTINTATLPRIFGVFWNSNNNKIFADKNVVTAFDKAIDRQEIIDKVLYGYADITHGPIPETIINDPSKEKYRNSSLDEARLILDNAGWIQGIDGIRSKGGITTVSKTKKVGKKTVTEKVTVNNGPVIRLSFSITTGNTPELKSVSLLIKEQLEKLGAQIDIKIYETGPLNQLIRARDYEVLFFGQIVNHESDLFSFWHSSQKADPGLNIAMYSNKDVDSILESAQKITTQKDRGGKYEDFIKEFNKDVPALLVYSPKYLYATSPKLGNLNLSTLTIPSDRFTQIFSWYADTENVWKIFTK